MSDRPLIPNPPPALAQRCLGSPAPSHPMPSGASGLENVEHRALAHYSPVVAMLTSEQPLIFAAPR